MKKKITYILSLLMIVCMLGACGSDNAEKTYGGYTTDELHTEATDSLSNIQNYIALVDSCGGYDSYEKIISICVRKLDSRRSRRPSKKNI